MVIIYQTEVISDQKEQDNKKQEIKISKRPAKKESTEENKEETPPKFIIIELKNQTC